MAKIEIRMSDAEKAQIDQAAEACGLRPATWARAQLILAARSVLRRKGES